MTIYDEFDLDCQFRMDNWQSLLDPDDLVNWEDDLNQGLLLWATLLPDRDGPGTWPFLVGGDGTYRNGAFVIPPLGLRSAFGCINFDGTDDDVLVNTRESLFDFERTNPFSVACRVYSVNTTDAGHTLVSKMDGVTARGWELTCFDGGTSSAVNFYLINTFPTSSIAVRTPNGSISAVRWHNVVATYDGSSAAAGVRIYIDGLAQSLNAWQDNLTTTTLNDKPVNFGRRDGARPLAGALNDVRIWDRELSAAQVQDYTQAVDLFFPRQLKWRRPAARYFAFPSLTPPATSYTFTGPTSGVVNVASSNFTVTPNGDADGITVTPASDGAGSFNPTSVTFTGSNAETFTYTPTDTAGSPHTLSVTDDGGLTDPAAIDYTVNEPGAGGDSGARMRRLLRP